MPLPLFDHQPRTRLIFGNGTLARVGELVRELGGQRALLVSDPGIVKAGYVARAAAYLNEAGVAAHIYGDVRENPSTEDVDRCVAVAREFGADFIIGLGGGSSMDTAKGCNFILTNGGRMQDYWGTGKATLPMLPMIAIPTTAGTGSEASTNAVLSRPGSHGFKKSLRHPAIRATAVALDGTMLTTQPAHLAAYCGLDAFTQLLESWSSHRAHHTAVAHLVSHLENGIEMAYHALPQLVELGPDHAAPHHRQAMLEAAFLSGIGLSHAGLGTAHGIAGHIGAYTTAPHAHACARLMAPCLRETLTWLENNPTSEHSAAALDQFRRLNQRLSPTLAPTHADAIQQILAWPQRFHIPPLLGYGLDLAAQEKILAAASDRDSPAHLGPAIWRRILQECLV